MNKPENQTIILPHGNYKKLLSYRKAEIIYDLTFRFCEKHLKKGDRTIDQMVQAARSGKQNIVEGSKSFRRLQRNGDQAHQCCAGQHGGASGRFS